MLRPIPASSMFSPYILFPSFSQSPLENSKMLTWPLKLPKLSELGDDTANLTWSGFDCPLNATL